MKRQSVTPGVSQTLAALQFVALLAVGGGRDADVHHVVAWRLVVCRSVCYLLLRHNAVDFCNGNNKGVKTDERLGRFTVVFRDKATARFWVVKFDQAAAGEWSVLAERRYREKM